ncbi:MAG: hypothetical protein K9L02_05990 [Acholeplasmataceae bacterium]|nr:hypothetical protein [Acholeplasmataceae bacterium]
MNYYIYVLKLSERLYDDNAWTKEDEAIINEHFFRLKKDYEAGKIIHVGRTEDPRNDGFGLVVYFAQDDKEAEKYMLDDPAVIHRLMTASYQPYRAVFNK